LVTYDKRHILDIPVEGRPRAAGQQDDPGAGLGLPLVGRQVEVPQDAAAALGTRATAAVGPLPAAAATQEQVVAVAPLGELLLPDEQVPGRRRSRLVPLLVCQAR